MANDMIWIEKFNISDELKSEYDQLPSASKTSFLAWCIEQGHVNQHEYLQWASEEFQMPIVHENFFFNEEAKRKWRATWTTARFLHQWNTSLLPLDEHAGIVRVGCLEVPDIKIDRPVAYVLAPLSGMKSLWQEAFGAPVVTPPTPVAAPVVVAETPAPPTPPPAPVEESIISIDLPPPPPSGEFDANSLMANWGAPPEISEPTAPDLPTPEEASAMPEGFTMPEGFSTTDIPLPTITAVAPTPEVAMSTPPPIVAVEAKPTPPSKPPIPPMAPSAAAKPPGELLGLIELRNAKEKFEECHTIAEVANTAFTKFSRYFDRHMILFVRANDVRPYVWAGNWKIRSVKPAPVNVELPSIFRTAFKTALPYHGYIKPCPINDLVFAEWNNGQTPAHITVMPLLHKGQVVAMYVGATDGTLDAKVALMDAERWCAEFAPALQRVHSIAAPKAA